MSTVWKTILKSLEVQAIEVPAGAELLCAREQNDMVCIWYRCDPSKRLESRAIAIVGTGHPCPDDGRYLGTASIYGGSLMFHVFEGPTPRVLGRHS